jgi:hypothetical protein
VALRCKTCCGSIVTTRPRKRPKPAQAATIKVPRVVQHTPRGRAWKLEPLDPEAKARAVEFFAKMGIKGLKELARSGPLALTPLTTIARCEPATLAFALMQPHQDIPGDALRLTIIRRDLGPHLLQHHDRLGDRVLPKEERPVRIPSHPGREREGRYVATGRVIAMRDASLLNEAYNPRICLFLRCRSSGSPRRGIDTGLRVSSSPAAR